MKTKLSWPVPSRLRSSLLAARQRNRAANSQVPTHPSSPMIAGRCIPVACVLLLLQSVYGAFNPTKLADADRAILEAITDNRMPGGVLGLQHNDDIYRKAHGKRALVPAEATMTADTIFDAGSLTKVIATTPAIMVLIERGRVRLDDPVRHYITNLHPDAAEITLLHLLTHTSGLRPGIPGTPAWRGYQHAIHLACQERPTNPPGTIFRYSDINFILLGEIVQRASGQ